MLSSLIISVVDILIFSYLIFKISNLHFSKNYSIERGTSPAIQWLKPCASNAGLQIQSLVGELRFHVLCGMAKKKSIARNNILCLSIANAFIDPSLSSILSLFLTKGCWTLTVSIKLFLYQIYSFVSIFF